MHKDRIFKIVYPQKAPIYIFSKASWVGLATTVRLYEASDGMIIPITFWQFIKEWIRK